MVNLRTPLIVTGLAAGGVPDLRVPLIEVQPVAAGVPDLRAPLITMQPMAGGVPHLRCALIVVQAVIPVPKELPVATLVFPTLRGLGWDRKKTPTFNTGVREMTSGRVSATPFMQYPRWAFELSYPTYLPDVGHDVTLARDTDLRVIGGFFQDCQGRGKAFLYPDRDDYHVVGGAIATGDAVTLQWPFLAAIFGSFQPVGQIDLSVLETFASTDVNTGTDAIHVAGHGLTTGQGPLWVSSAGTLPTPLVAATAYWAIAVDADHFQLATSKANALANTAINITAAGSGADTLSKGVAVYDNGVLQGPTAWSLTLPNQLVFASAPLAGHAITADFDFYFVCRFTDDAAEFNQFASKLHDLQKLDFKSEPTG